MSTILVCGGRDYADRQVAFAELDRIRRQYGVTRVIHGDARGADTLASAWALANRIPMDAYPALWKKHGRAAGPLRNRQMLESGHPHFVVAFPGGVGTADMVRQAREHGVPVILAGEHA